VKTILFFFIPIFV
jgi:hypothetical protein